jgi:hypothetical protein
MEAMAMLGVGMLVGLLVVAVIGALFGALILKFIIKLLEKFAPSFGRSLLVVVVAGAVGFVAYMLLAVAMVGTGGAMVDPNDQAAMAAMAGKSLMAMGLSLVAYFLIYAGAIHLLVKRPDGGAYGFGRALLASLLYMIVMVVIGVIASIVLAVVFGAAIGGMAGMAG